MPRIELLIKRQQKVSPQRLFKILNDSFKTIANTGKNDNGKRADRIIRKILPSIPLGDIYKEMRKGKIRLNGKKIVPDKRVEEGDSIDIHTSLLSFFEKASAAIKKSLTQPNCVNIKLEIIFENNMIGVVNKPTGIAVHDKFSLSDIIKNKYSEICKDSLSFTPAPLHRLDKNTSGVLFFGKSIEGARLFSFLLKERKMIKTYIALIDGNLEKSYRWVDYLKREKEEQAKEAITTVKPLICSKKHTLAEVKIETGRYHQIRRHCSLHNYPLSGDVKYGGNPINNFKSNKYLLHSLSLEFMPCSETEKLAIPDFKVSAPLPLDFISITEKLFPIKNIYDIIKL